MKQTAVEWLENEVYKAIENTSENSINYVLEKLFEQAKEVEKEQKHSEYMRGWYDGVDITKLNTKQ